MLVGDSGGAYGFQAGDIGWTIFYSMNATQLGNLLAFFFFAVAFSFLFTMPIQ
jgi:hypothetical protein